MSLPAVSKHLKVLERRLIARPQAQWRPCRLWGGPLKDAAEMARTLSPVLGAEPRPARDYTLRGLQQAEKSDGPEH